MSPASFASGLAWLKKHFGPPEWDLRHDGTPSYPEQINNPQEAQMRLKRTKVPEQPQDTKVPEQHAGHLRRYRLLRGLRGPQKATS